MDSPFLQFSFLPLTCGINEQRALNYLLTHTLLADEVIFFKEEK